jgi:hypothetical protein
MDVGKEREQERKLCPGMGGMPQGAKDGIPDENAIVNITNTEEKK